MSSPWLGRSTRHGSDQWPINEFKSRAFAVPPHLQAYYSIFASPCLKISSLTPQLTGFLQCFHVPTRRKVQPHLAHEFPSVFENASDWSFARRSLQPHGKSVRSDSRVTTRTWIGRVGGKSVHKRFEALGDALFRVLALQRSATQSLLVRRCAIS